jgi:hypothetical protein
VAFPEGFASFALEDLAARVAWERVDPVDRRRALESGQPLAESDRASSENTATAEAGSGSGPP